MTMSKDSYVKSLLDEFCGKDKVDSEVEDNTLKRLFRGYTVIAEEISKDLELKAYKEKGVRP